MGGVLIGLIGASIYLWLRHRLKKEKLPQVLNRRISGKEYRRNINTILAMAVPIVIGSLVTQIASLIDVLTVQGSLAKLVEKNPGYFEMKYPEMWMTLSQNEGAIPTFLYGCYRGFAMPIYALVPNLTAVIGVSLVPVLTSAWEKASRHDIRKVLDSMMKITAVVALPVACGIAVLGSQILALLYGTKPVGAEIAAEQLKILSICVIFGGFSVPFTAVLQAIGKEKIPVINMAIAAGLKIVFNFLLVGTTRFHINGAAISTVICYLFLFVSNLIFILHYTGFKPKIFDDFFKPFMAAVGCAIVGYFSFFGLSKILSRNVSTIVSVLFSMIIYLLLLYVFKIFTIRELFLLFNKQKKPKTT